MQKNFVLDEPSPEASLIKMEVDASGNGQQPNQAETEKRSPNRTPTNVSPILTPRAGSPNELSSSFLTSILDSKEENQLLEDLFVAVSSSHHSQRTSSDDFSSIEEGPSGNESQPPDPNPDTGSQPQLDGFYGAFTAYHTGKKNPGMPNYDSFLKRDCKVVKRVVWKLNLKSYTTNKV